ncbi:MAG: bacteriohemerythrin [Bdellovibrionota bacterium]
MFDVGKRPESIIWQDTWSVGNDLLDLHHKRIIAYINDLVKISNLNLDGAGVDSVKVDKILESLLDFTLFHFAAEEKLLERYNYNALDRHKKIHKNLIAQLQNLRSKFSKVGMPVLPFILNFLNAWLRDHILGVDMKYSKIVSKRDTV